MAKQTIDVGSSANDGTGDFLRPAFIKVNENFTELYDFDAALATVATTGEYDDLNNTPALGSAALLDVGTDAGDVVQLDGTGKLPAVDGSQLTNLPAGGGTVDVSGTPTDDQLARWVDEDTLEGVSTITLSYISDAGDLAGQNQADFNFVPDGGTTGQVLAKASNDDGDTEWVEAAGGGSGTVDVSGTPTATQLARWTDADTLEGVDEIALSYIIASDLQSQTAGGHYSTALQALVQGDREDFIEGLVDGIIAADEIFALNSLGEIVGLTAVTPTPVSYANLISGTDDDEEEVTASALADARGPSTHAASASTLTLDFDGVDRLNVEITVDGNNRTIEVDTMPAGLKYQAFTLIFVRSGATSGAITLGTSFTRSIEFDDGWALPETAGSYAIVQGMIMTTTLALLTSVTTYEA